MASRQHGGVFLELAMMEGAATGDGPTSSSRIAGDLEKIVGEVVGMGRIGDWRNNDFGGD